VQAQLGTLYLINKDLQAARTTYERALSIDSTALEAVGGLVEMDLKAGKTASALARADAALAAAPRSAGLLIIAAQAYATAGNLSKAEQLLRAAITADPLRQPAYGLLAQIYVKQNRLDAAIAELELVARQPDGVAAATLIGMLLEQQNKTAEARARYERTVQTFPRAPVAANNLAWIYAENGGNLERALELAKTAKTELPESAEVSDTIGWIYYRKKMFPQAIAALKEAVGRTPDNTMMHYHLGLAYAGASEYSLAKSTLVGALKAAPNSPLASEARTALNLISTIGL
jgi:tetratricopeptide (TPR) repeat protein